MPASVQSPPDVVNLGNQLSTSPKPGVRQVGQRCTVAVAKTGDRLDCFFPPDDDDLAKEFVRSIANDYDEVIIVTGPIIFRIWDRNIT